MIDCDAVMRELWEFLDEELSPERLSAMQEHLRLCDRCGSHANFGRAYQAAVAAAVRGGGAPAALASRVREALRAHGFEDPR